MAALVVLLAGSGRAADSIAAPAVTPSWVEVSSDHFTLYTTADEASAGRLVRHFEMVREALHTAFEWAGSRERAVRIVAFRSGAEMRAYSPNDRVSGYFLPGSARDFIVMATPSTDTRTAAHEYGHLILSQNGLDLPCWLSEGLAELYSNFEMTDGGMRVGGFITGRLTTLRTRRWIPLDELLQADYRSRVYQSAEYSLSAYAENWLLAHMLVLDPRYSDGFARLLAEVQHTGAAQAFWDVYGKRVAEVEEDLKRYVETGERNARTIRTPGAVPDPAMDPQEDGALRVAEDAGYGARVALAEILTNYPGRLTQARMAYDELEREYPMEVEVQQGLADVYAREGLERAAAEHRARAARLLAERER